MELTKAGHIRVSLKEYLHQTFGKNSIDCGNDMLKEIERLPKEHLGPRLAHLAKDLTDVVMLGSEH